MKQICFNVSKIDNDHTILLPFKKCCKIFIARIPQDNICFFPIYRIKEFQQMLYVQCLSSLIIILKIFYIFLL